MDIHKGEQYDIPFEITVGGEAVTPASCSGVRIQVGNRMCQYPDGELRYDSEDGVWLYPLTEEQSMNTFAGARKAQVAVRYIHDIVMSDVIAVPFLESIIKKRWVQDNG